MLYSLQAVRDNLRNREGKRVFYLGKGDQLTSEARDFLTQERIEILPADQARPTEYRLLGGGTVSEKPEDMTHLNAEYLVKKTHPRIRFRGAMDTLEAELLLCQLQAGESLREQLGQVLELARIVTKYSGRMTVMCWKSRQRRRHFAALVSRSCGSAAIGLRNIMGSPILCLRQRMVR